MLTNDTAKLIGVNLNREFIVFRLNRHGCSSIFLHSRRGIVVSNHFIQSKRNSTRRYAIWSYIEIGSKVIRGLSILMYMLTIQLKRSFLISNVGSFIVLLLNCIWVTKVVVWPIFKLICSPSIKIACFLPYFLLCKGILKRISIFFLNFS